MFPLLICTVFLGVLYAVVAKSPDLSTEVSFKLFTHNKTKYKTHYMTPGKIFHCCVTSYQVPPLDIFCYNGHEPRLEYFWQVAILRVSLLNGEYDHYLGPSAAEVVDNYVRNTPVQVTNDTRIRLNPFDVNCVGIRSGHLRYRVALELEQFEIRFWWTFALGVVLYLATSNVYCMSLHKRWNLSVVGICIVWALWAMTKGLGLALLRGCSYHHEAAIKVVFAFPVLSVVPPMLRMTFRAFTKRKLAPADIPEYVN